MQLGWIDFSKSERCKILSVLDLLQQPGTLDELGIAPVRDGFSNIFFPGTSTIQTRAKYFMLIPYALKDLERSSETNPNVLRRTLDAIERECGELLLAQNKDERGIIGARSLKHGQWVKRAPVEIYWNGLRQYGFFTGGNLTLTEYLRISCALKNRKRTLKKLGNRNDNAEENECDDKDAGNNSSFQFLNIPIYDPNWKSELKMELNAAEADFLKKQIIANYPDTMLGYILKNNLTNVLACENFDAIAELIDMFPEHIQDDYWLALQFSHFLYIVRVAYNIIVSDSKNEEANSEYARLRPLFPEEASVDLDRVFTRLALFGKSALCNFLRSAQRSILADDFEGLCKCIKDQEILLKGSGRAKTAHPGEYRPDTWFCGDYLDYRFPNARSIMMDIFEGEVTKDAES